jgi:hypothetical protein
MQSLNLTPVMLPLVSAASSSMEFQLHHDDRSPIFSPSVPESDPLPSECGLGAGGDPQLCGYIFQAFSYWNLELVRLSNAGSLSFIWRVWEWRVRTVLWAIDTSNRASKRAKGESLVKEALMRKMPLLEHTETPPKGGHLSCPVSSPVAQENILEEMAVQDPWRLLGTVI